MSDPLSLTLTNRQLVRLDAALGGLDGIAMKEREFEPFKFNSETAFKIANNVAVVKDSLGAFERCKKLLAVKYQIGERMSVTAENAQQVSDFLEALGQLEEKQVEVCGLEMLSRASLNVGDDKKKNQNQILPSTLAGLIVVLEP